MTYQVQAPVGRVTPGLREAALIEYVGNDDAAGFAVVQAMLEAGFVIREVERPSGLADALILAHGLAGECLAAHTTAVEALSHAARSFEERGGTLLILQDTGGHFQPVDQRAWRGGFAGLARTAAREFPKAMVRTIDIDMGGMGMRPAADRVIEELLSGGTAPCIGLTANSRVAPTDTELLLPDHPSHPLGKDDVILVTGGARGVTADCTIELARRTHARFALLGRSEITPWPDGLAPDLDEKSLRGALVARARERGQKVSPADISREARALLASAEIRQTLDAIRQAGGTALYLPVDIADGPALGIALETIQSRLGPVTGLVHGAGVLADKLIREKTADQVARVFSPKIQGLETLLSQLETSQLKIINFFSSVAARYGNAGQADYAMANEILNRMAHWLKAEYPDAAVTSIGWGPWDGGMVDDSLRAKFAEMGVPLIPRDAGAGMFADAVLAGAGCPVELVIGAEISHG